MKNTTQNHTLTATAQLSEAPNAEELDISPLSPSKRLELWSGRFAMVGFVTTVAAIALSSTL
ncbi:MAG: hypothetical protein ACFBSF_14025 [Leptolyngbyaceae cyanobacterium]